MEGTNNQPTKGHDARSLESRLADLEHDVSLLVQLLQESQLHDDNMWQQWHRVRELEGTVAQLQAQLAAETERRKVAQSAQERLQRQLEKTNRALADVQAETSIYIDGIEQREILQRREEGLAFYLSRLNCTKF